jgi:hypothetical protein
VIELTNSIVNTRGYFFETDINECQEGTDNCDRQSTYCSNVEGFFYCYCNPGYGYVNSTYCKGEYFNLYVIDYSVILVELKVKGKHLTKPLALLEADIYSHLKKRCRRPATRLRGASDS